MLFPNWKKNNRKIFAMSVKNEFIAELKLESAQTKKMLERVPLEKKDWKPHEKSMTVGRLATHIAENIGWISKILHLPEHDFAAVKFAPHTAASTEELL